MNLDKLLHRLILALGIIFTIRVSLLSVLAAKKIVDLLFLPMDLGVAVGFVYLGWKYMKIKEAEKK